MDIETCHGTQDMSWNTRHAMRHMLPQEDIIQYNFLIRKSLQLFFHVS